MSSAGGVRIERAAMADFLDAEFAGRDDIDAIVATSGRQVYQRGMAPSEGGKILHGKIIWAAFNARFTAA